MLEKGRTRKKIGNSSINEIVVGLLLGAVISAQNGRKSWRRLRSVYARVNQLITVSSGPRASSASNHPFFQVARERRRRGGSRLKRDAKPLSLLLFSSLLRETWQIGFAQPMMASESSYAKWISR